MKISIDFSIFDSPTGAYGNATGKIDVSSIPPVGSVLDLGIDRKDDAYRDISDMFRVKSVTTINDTGDVIVELNDVVVSSREAAIRLATKLSDDIGLFVIDYDHN